MTLVVARITPLGVRMAAAMRVTDPSHVQRGYVHAALKAVLLSPTLCVGYAATSAHADDEPCDRLRNAAVVTPSLFKRLRAGGPRCA